VLTYILKREEEYVKYLVPNLLWFFLIFNHFESEKQRQMVRTTDKTYHYLLELSIKLIKYSNDPHTECVDL